MCSILFCAFLFRCFARLQRETSRNLFMEEMSYVLSFTFFSMPLIFVATSISHFVTAATKLSCCSSNKKMCLLCFLSLALDLCRPFFR